MDKTIFVALISATTALVSAGFAIWGQVRLRRMSAELDQMVRHEADRKESAKVARRYHEPLARAAYDLQSRLYNILNRNFTLRYLAQGNDRERAYAVNNTIFLIAQYLAWTEIIRVAIQYVDLGTSEQTRQFARLQDGIYSLFTTDTFPPPFRIFAGEQRAIGERMIRQTDDGPECIGYGEFLDRFAAPADPLLEFVRNDVAALEGDLEMARPRLIALQHALIELLEFLDPQYIRFDKAVRTRA
jgi:hypothetical protein